jgi:putative endonuclease
MNEVYKIKNYKPSEMQNNMYVYMLKCIDGSYYTGVTNNVDRRFNEHESGMNIDCYTYKRRPLILVFCEKFDTPIKAIEFEKKLKKWSRAKKEALINQNWEKLQELAKCSNSSSHKFYNRLSTSLEVTGGVDYSKRHPDGHPERSRGAIDEEL